MEKVNNTYTVIQLNQQSNAQVAAEKDNSRPIRFTFKGKDFKGTPTSDFVYYSGVERFIGKDGPFEGPIFIANVSITSIPSEDSPYSKAKFYEGLLSNDGELFKPIDKEQKLFPNSCVINVNGKSYDLMGKISADDLAQVQASKNPKVAEVVGQKKSPPQPVELPTCKEKGREIVVATRDSTTEGLDPTKYDTYNTVNAEK
jgi:hypothetical protein